MAQQVINIGSTANDGTGDPLRTAFTKANQNFSELYAKGAAGSNLDLSNNKIEATNTNGNIELTPNGAGKIVIVDDVLLINTSRTPSAIGAAGDIKGSICLDASALYYCTGNYDGSTTIWKTLNPDLFAELFADPAIVRLNLDRTKTTNNTSLEAVFAAANDTIALTSNTLYQFKGTYIMSTSATASNAGLQTGFTFSNAQQDIGYKFRSYPQASSTSQTTGYATVATATLVTLTTTSATNYVIEIEGWFKSNATTGGTLIPAFTQSVVGTSVAPTASANSWFMLQAMGSASATVLAGSWT